MNMVKTLFLCNHRQTEFYLFIMPGNKRFKTKLFSSALNISRVSFAPSEKMEEMLETSIGAVLIIGGALWDELRQGKFKTPENI
ncbi:MAG: hypothetical protein LUG24_03615 [Clostridiales bacterium]|nr:hypothetical protein [Clostridiales bacterium]